MASVAVEPQPPLLLPVATAYLPLYPLACTEKVALDDALYIKKFMLSSNEAKLCASPFVASEI